MSARSLDDLFNADVETLTDADIEKMIAELRTQRSFYKHAKAQKTAKTTAIPLGSSEDILELIGLGKKP